MKSYDIASDSVLESPVGLRPGSRVAKPPRRSPGRSVHAVEPGAEVTLCGIDTTDLHDEWDTPFSAINGQAKCLECRELAGD